MSEDRERAYRVALGAVLRAAVDQGVNLDTLSEAAIQLMLNDIAYTQDDVAEAVIAIEVAADAVAVG